MSTVVKTTSPSSFTSRAIGLGVMLGFAALATSPASASLARVPAPAPKTSMLEVVGMTGISPDTLPVPTVRKAPAYPLRAIETEREGWVIVEMDVDETGLPVNAKVAETKANKVFNRSALAALEDFRFEPATLDGRPVAVSGVRYKIVYSLADG